MKQEFFFLGEKRLQVWVRLDMEWNGLNWAIMPFGDWDGGVFVFHIDMVKRGSVLFITIKEGKLRELKGSIHQVLIPQEPWVNSGLGFITVVWWRGGVSKSWAGIDGKRYGRRGGWGSGIIFSLGEKGLNQFCNRIGSGGVR
jgi:hypothetical protein